MKKLSFFHTPFLTHKAIEKIPSFMRRNEKQLNMKMCKMLKNKGLSP